MVTITLRPVAAGDYTEWPSQYPASTYHWDKVDEAVSDDATTYIGLGSIAYKLDLFQHEGYVTSGTITELRLYAVCRNTAGGSSYSWWKGALRLDGATYYGTEKAYTSTFIWTSRDWTWTTNPATGLAWRWSDIQDLQFGLAARTGTNTSTAACTQIYIEIDNTPDPSGGNVFSGGFF